MPSTERGQKTTASFKTRGKEKLQDEGSDKASKGRETKGVGTKDKLEQRTKERRTKAQNRKQRGGGGTRKNPSVAVLEGPAGGQWVAQAQPCSYWSPTGSEGPRAHGCL